MPVSIENANKALFAKQIVQDFTKKITGEDEERVVGINPEDKFFVGKLSPKQENDISSSKTFINQIGLDFVINKEELNSATLLITPQGEFYYRVIPTLKEQRDVFVEEYKLANGIEEISFEEIVSNIRDDKTDDKLYFYSIAPVYKKLRLTDEFSIKVELKNIMRSEGVYGYKKIEDELTKKLEILIEQVMQEKEALRDYRTKVGVADLVDEASWELYLHKGKEPVYPIWAFSVEVEVKKYRSDQYKIQVTLSNEMNKEEESKGRGKDNRDKKIIDTLFNAGIILELEGAEYQPTKLEYFDEDYKYERTAVAIGNNCSIIQKTPQIIATTNIPLFEQKRLKTKDEIEAKFQDLIVSPIETLEKIHQFMIKDLEQLKEEYEFLKDHLVEGEKENRRAQEKYLQEITEFRFEIERFKNGIDKLKCKQEMKKAFILMNKAFSKNNKGFDRWRLFQIVFIVSLIPDVGVSEYGEEEMGPKNKIDEVDVLYFPTGGGKTEAFLGVTIFTAFFDRIRGKHAGISSIIKYPLRLLSVQQMQRIADVLAQSEIIRREEIPNEVGEEFSLGYYVGDVNTPNKLDTKLIEEIKKNSQDNINNKYKIIDKCPFCGGTNIDIEIDEVSYRIKHRCNNPQCSSGGFLPLYLVDREIYRYLPTVLVSTIDKIAAIGYQPNFKNILGEVSFKCIQHGYTSKNKCTEYDVCKLSPDNLKRVAIKDPAPSLLIQDELHLVRESLGAFDGHYETAFQYMIKCLGQSKKKIKIIGATATISSYKTQIKHLYGKNATRFPSEYPKLDRNFYSYIDQEETHRIIIGYAPYAKAIINSVVYSMKYLKEVLETYKKDISKIMRIPGIDLNSTEEAKKLLQDYWFLLEYNNVKQDGNKVIGAIETPINVELKNQGIQQFDYRKMTGDDSFQDVRKVLAEVENTKDVFNGFNLIVATSMISHGVDADKFNNMMFFGMPGNTAEYIQAYSRVGRKYPGIVIVLLRPTRDKDLSYLRHFNKFHEYKDILVDPVPINRWAKKAVDKTFPGIFQAIIFNYYEVVLGSLYKAQSFKNAIEEGRILKEEVVEHILKAYTCMEENNRIKDIGRQYKVAIEEKVELIFDEVRNKTFAKDDNLSDELEKILHQRVMTSLRDSEEQVKIRLE